MRTRDRAEFRGPDLHRLHEAVTEYIRFQVGSGHWTAGEADAGGWTALADRLTALAQRQPLVLTP